MPTIEAVATHTVFCTDPVSRAICAPRLINASPSPRSARFAPGATIRPAPPARFAPVSTIRPAPV
jgi:hypothetical protein